MELVMYLLFQKILLIHTNFLIPNTHPYDWFKLSYECFGVPFLPLYLLFWPFWGLFTHIGVSKTWPHKKDVHHFWSLHPPWRYAPSVGLKHDTKGNFLALGLTWIPKMGGWLLYYVLRGRYIEKNLKSISLSIFPKYLHSRKVKNK